MNRLEFGLDSGRMSGDEIGHGWVGIWGRRARIFKYKVDYNQQINIVQEILPECAVEVVEFIAALSNNTSKQNLQLAQLADIAQQCKSLFYDEPKKGSLNKRRKYAFSVKQDKSDSSGPPRKQQKPPLKSKAFESFNFDQQSYSFAKDCEALKKVQESVKKNTRKTNFAILTDLSTHLIASVLESALGIGRETPEGPPRAINLCVHRFFGIQERQLYIDCYWIIDVSQASHFGCLFNVYIQKSSQVLNLRSVDLGDDQSQDKLAMLNSSIRGLIQRISSKRSEEAMQAR